MRCAIVRPRPEGLAWEMAEPLGAEAICGYLREHGISCRVFDRRIGASVREIAAADPDAVGFSLMTQEDVPDALRTLQMLKKPGRLFFAGGLFVTFEENRCRALFPRDTVLIRGEGEGPVLSLLTERMGAGGLSLGAEQSLAAGRPETCGLGGDPDNSLAADRPAAGRPEAGGLSLEADQSLAAYRPAAGGPEGGEPEASGLSLGSDQSLAAYRPAAGGPGDPAASMPKSIPDPDGWARASRDDLDRYLTLGGAIQIRSSRGCRGACAFCTTPGISHGRHQERNIFLVAAEMADLARRGYPPVFNFTDDEFGDLDRIMNLVQALEQEGVRAAFSLELRPAVVCSGTPALWRRLHQGGLCRIFTGLENLDPDTLRHWGKPTDPGKLLQAVDQCQQAGILCQLGYILFHDRSTVADVMDQVRTLHRIGRFTPKAALSVLSLYPGSRLYDQAGGGGDARKQNGLKGDRPEDYMTGDGRPEDYRPEDYRPGTGRPGSKSIHRRLIGPVPADLPEEVAVLYESWAARLEDYLALWSKCAGRLPNAACMAHLSGDRRQLDLLQTALERINDLSYRIIEGEEISEPEKEEMYALCSSALGAGGA